MNDLLLAVPLDILWLTTDYPWPDSPILGIFHGTAARALARLGLAITVVAPTPIAPWPLSALRDRWLRYSRAPREAVDAGVRIFRPRYPAVPGEPDWARTDRQYASAAMRVRRWAWPRARVIHAHYAAPVGMAAHRLSKRTGIPYVITLHGGDITTWPGQHPGRLAELQETLRDASRVVAVSQALADEAEKVAGVKPIVIPIGIETARFSAPIDRAAVRRMLGVADDDILMLMVAYLEPRKRVRDLVDGIRLAGRPFRAIFIGTGPEEGYGALPGTIDYLGPRANTDIPRLLAAADLTVLPSDDEGLPTALVEAGAAGVPVIASRAGGTPELLADDRGVLLDSVSPETIADALRAFAADRPAAKLRADRLREHVLAEYDADGSAERLARVYAEVAAAAGKP